MIEFSVIIPLYNKALSISNTIHSVLSQTYPYFELIIVNDGSTDNSLEIASSFNDSRIKVYNKPNGGVSSARNYGIGEAKKDYISFLDGDDLWFENCLDEFKTLIENYQKAQVFCTSHTLSVKSIASRNRRYYVDNFWKQNAISYARNNTALVCTGCIAFERQCLERVEGFNTNLTHGEDLDFWHRLANNFTFAKSEIITMLYRLNAENRSDTTKLRKAINFVNRNEANDKFEALDYGRIYFFEVYYELKQLRDLKKCFELILRYGDWMFRFLLTVVYVRVLKK